MKANPYTLIESPTPDKAADPDFPHIVAEAFQVFECTWDDRFGLHDMQDDTGQNYESHFNLMIDNILVKEEYRAGRRERRRLSRYLPVFCGFRPATGFWFAETHAPFAVPLPKVEGRDGQHIFYVGNRIDANVQFTQEACQKLTGIPRPFLKQVLTSIVERARDDGVAVIDEAYLAKIRPS